MGIHSVSRLFSVLGDRRSGAVAPTMIQSTQSYNLLVWVFLSSKLCLLSGYLFFILFFSCSKLQSCQLWFIRYNVHTNSISQSKEVENTLGVRKSYFCLCVATTALQNVIVSLRLNFPISIWRFTGIMWK